MRKIYSFTFLLLTIICLAQVKFESGYIIDNRGDRKNVLIKNVDWVKNPKEIEVKSDAESKDVKLYSIEDIKEFGINSFSKYIRENVKIDESSFFIGELSNDKAPVYHEQVVFLKVLVEGEANLYLYREGSLLKLFYKTENEAISLLIYKMYKVGEDGKYAYNMTYKAQLSRYLNCSSIAKSDFDKLNYDVKQVSNLFVEYNNCNNNTAYEDSQIKNKIDINLSLRPRLQSNSLDFSNSLENYSTGNKIGFGFGIEGEYILPFNKNKWGFIVEPTYTSFSETLDNPLQDKSNVSINYSLLELPIGIRHYFYLNSKSKLFINAQYVVNFNFNSSIEFKNIDESAYRVLDIKTNNNTIAFGVGYNYNSKVSAELRYFTNRNLLSNYPYWNSDFKSISFIIGYNLF